MTQVRIESDRRDKTREGGLNHLIREERMGGRWIPEIRFIDDEKITKQPDWLLAKKTLLAWHEAGQNPRR
jgi:hypothetical protein